MSYRLTNRAEIDLEEIGRFFGEVNPEAGERLFLALEAKWDLLARHSEIGPARPEFGAEMRTVAVGNYLTFYRVQDGDVVIVRIMDGRRRLGAKDFVE